MSSSSFNIKKNNQSGSLIPLPTDVTSEEFYLDPRIEPDIEEIIATLANLDKFGSEMGAREIVLKGPPGVGKSLCISYIATRLGCELYDGSNWNDAMQIQKGYDELRTRASNGPVILQLDELDRYSTRDKTMDPTVRLSVSQLLVELQKKEENKNLVTIATTNHEDNIDIALRRGGRFEREIEFPTPDADGRLKIFDIHAYKMGHDFNFKRKDLEMISEETFGYTGADIRKIMNLAMSHSIVDKRTRIAYEDLLYAKEKTIPSGLMDMPVIVPKTGFSDFAGYGGLKALTRRIIKNSDGANIFIYGPKGTGKTYLAECVAGEFNFNYMEVHGSSPEEMWVGETEKNITKYFTRAKQCAPCVLLFDEMPSLVENRHMSSVKTGWTGLIQAKMKRPIDGVYIIATANNPDSISPAMIDRFTHKIYLGMPDENDLEEIWKYHVGDDVDSRALVEANPNLSPRDVWRIQRQVHDYGIKPSLDVYQKLAKRISNEDLDGFEADYYSFQNKYGDSLRDYMILRDILEI